MFDDPELLDTLIVLGMLVWVVVIFALVIDAVKRNKR